jgi:hypothetical protein
MRKLIIVASLIAVGGIAGAASADSGAEKARYHTISGRTLVWHQPKAEQPYALRGVDAAPQAEKARIEFRQHGRAGTSLEVRPQASR